MTTIDLAAIADAAARLFDQSHRRVWASPAALARQFDPRFNQTAALDLIDSRLVKLYDQSDGRLILSCPPQQGKALALDTPVPTPTGWTTMGELRPGDRVFGRDGRPCSVTAVSPVWRDRPCYAVTTADGDRIVADAEHEWPTRLDRRSPERLQTSRTLARSRSKSAQITAGAALELPEIDLPIDPYALGVWLGDGTSAAAQATLNPNDAPEITARCAARGWPMRHLGELRWSFAEPERRNRFWSALQGLDLVNNKHVPPIYLRGSFDQRLALLQGLIDTDGYVNEGSGVIEFTTTTRALANDVHELIFSLGRKVTIREGRATLYGKDCGPKYRLVFMMKDAASLRRRHERARDSSASSIRYVSAAPCEPCDTVCIEVDSADHLFLAGRSMLPTHNSTLAAKWFALWALVQNQDLRIAVVSYEHNVARRWGRAVRDTIIGHPELGLRVRPDLSAQHEWQLTGAEGGVYSAGIGAALTGRPVDLLIIDDPIKDHEQADSTVYRERIWDWWTGTGSTRLGPGAPVIQIATRWHEADLAGQLLAAEDGHVWDVVNIPAQADHRPELGEVDPLGREVGEFMVSTRRNRAGRPLTIKQWEAIKVRAGSRDWNAMYQGRPSPAEGGILKRDHWRRYDTPMWAEREDGSMIAIDDEATLIQSWDMAFKSTAQSDFVCGQVWLKKGAHVYLVDQTHGRFDFVQTCREVRRLAAKWPQAALKLVEDAANGPAVISALERVVSGLVAEPPQGSKESRVAAITPFVEAGNVHLPSSELAPWADALIEEAAAFPNSPNDDRVDALAMAINRLLLQPIMTDDPYVTSEDWSDYDSRGWYLTPY